MAAYHRLVPRIELAADLNGQDDDGNGWSMLADPADPTSVQPGMVLLAGNRQATARERILSVEADGQIHFEIL